MAYSIISEIPSTRLKAKTLVLGLGTTTLRRLSDQVAFNRLDARVRGARPGQHPPTYWRGVVSPGPSGLRLFARRVLIGRVPESKAALSKSPAAVLSLLTLPAIHSIHSIHLELRMDDELWMRRGEVKAALALRMAPTHSWSLNLRLKARWKTF